MLFYLYYDESGPLPGPHAAEVFTQDRWVLGEAVAQIAIGLDGKPFILSISDAPEGVTEDNCRLASANLRFRPGARVWRIFDPSSGFLCSKSGPYGNDGRSVWGGPRSAAAAMERMPEGVRSRAQIKEYLLLSTMEGAHG